MSNLVSIGGDGRHLDRTAIIAEEIKSLIYKLGEGLPLASVIGILEVVKIEVLNDHAN